MSALEELATRTLETVQSLGSAMDRRVPILIAFKQVTNQREKLLRAALMDFVRVEQMFGHVGQHLPSECADCKRVIQATTALEHDYLSK